METLQKTIRLHRVQSAFRKSTAIYRAFMGGRGAGKSWIGAYDMLRRAERGRTYLVASPSGVKLKDETFPTLKAIAEDLGIWNPAGVRLSPYPTVRLATGATIRFRSAEKPDSLRGPNLSGVWLDEGSLMEEAAYTIVIGCLREAGRQGWLSCTATPNGTSHWTYKTFGTKRAHTELFTAPTRANPFLPRDFAATLATQYVGAWALQELEGLFVQMEGAEFPAEFFEGILFDGWPDDMHRYLRVMSLDPSKGKQDASGDFSAWIMNAIDPDTQVLWVDADLDARRPVEPLASSPGMPSIVTDGIEHYKQFRPAGVLVETNGFQHMVADALLRHSQARHPHADLHGQPHRAEAAADSEPDAVPGPASAAHQEHARRAAAGRAAPGLPGRQQEDIRHPRRRARRAGGKRGDGEQADVWRRERRPSPGAVRLSGYTWITNAKTAYEMEPIMVKRIATALTIVVATVGLAVVPAPEATLPKSSPVYVEVHRKPGVSLEDAAKEAINVAVQLRRHIAFETHDEVRFLIVTPEDTLAEVLDRHQVHLEAVRNQD